jgi:hypothetical protein
MNDESDCQVIPDYVNFNWTRYKSFRRIQSGHQVSLGEHSSYFEWDIANCPNDLSVDDYLFGLNLRIRWLPNHKGQSLLDQLRNFNIYYVVEGLEQLPGLRASGYFWTSIHRGTGWGSFIPPDSGVAKEFWRLLDMENCRTTIAAGKAAATKLAELKKSGSYV